MACSHVKKLYKNLFFCVIYTKLFNLIQNSVMFINEVFSVRLSSLIKRLLTYLQKRHLYVNLALCTWPIISSDVLSPLKLNFVNRHFGVRKPVEYPNNKRWHLLKSIHTFKIYLKALFAFAAFFISWNRILSILACNNRIIITEYAPLQMPIS